MLIKKSKLNRPLISSLQLDVDEEPDLNIPEEFRVQAHDIVLEAEKQAQQKLTQAELQAQEIIAEAQKEEVRVLNEIQRLAGEFEKSKQSFYESIEIEKQKAFQDAMNNAQVIVEDLKRALNEFYKVKMNLVEEAKSEFLPLALDIAKQVLGYEAKTSPRVLEEQIQKAIAKVVYGKANVQVFINPADYSKAHDLKASISVVIDPEINLNFVSDAEVDLGSCVIETTGGKFDARFTTQINTIIRAFEKYLGESIKELENPPEEVLEEIEEVPEEVLKEIEGVQDNLLTVDDDLMSLLSNIGLDDNNISKSLNNDRGTEFMTKKKPWDEDNDLEADELLEADEDLLDDDLDEDDVEEETYLEEAEELADDEDFEEDETDPRFPDY